MPVKVYTSSQVGAPVMNGVVGSLIGVLDACLVNGYAAAAVESITVSDNTATVKTTAAHGFAEGDYALIAGAAEDDFNGEFKVRLVDSLRFSYPLYNASAGAATGASITVRRPGAGWEKPFAIANQGVYRAKEGLRHYLHVNDSAATAGGVREASMRGYRSMTSLTESVEPFPTTAQKLAGIMVYKTATANTNSQPWYVIADERFFYLGTQIDGAANGLTQFTGGSWPYWHCFGEIAAPFIESDPYVTAIAGISTANSIGSNVINGAFYPSGRNNSGSGSDSAFLLRGIGMLEGAPVQYTNMGHCWDETAIGEAQCFPYPHKNDNGMMICPVRCCSEQALRGYMPGLYESMHGNISSTVPVGTVFDGEFLGLEGRKLMHVTGRQNASIGSALFDITGPWR